MSADYESAHYKAYYHSDRGYFAVYEKTTDSHIGSFSPKEIAELAEISADFAGDAESGHDTSSDDVTQIVVTADMQQEIRAWLADRGQYLFPIPVTDDLPTFGIGTKEREP